MEYLMSNFGSAVKLSDKAKELGVSSRELMALLNDAGYVYANGNASLKADALQFLFLEHERLLNKTEVADAIENAFVAPIGDKFAVIRILINAKLEVQEVSRELFENRTRAYYELSYLNSKYEIGR
jgi:hypothetical protein